MISVSNLSGAASVVCIVSPAWTHISFFSHSSDKIVFNAVMPEAHREFQINHVPNVKKDGMLYDTYSIVLEADPHFLAKKGMFKVKVVPPNRIKLLMPSASYNTLSPMKTSLLNRKL